MSEEEFDFQSNIRTVIEFQYLLPPRYTDELEILILVSQECWFRLKEIAYFSPHPNNRIELAFGTIYGHKYSVDLGLTGLKFKPVWQRKEQCTSKN